MPNTRALFLGIPTDLPWAELAAILSSTHRWTCLFHNLIQRDQLSCPWRAFFVRSGRPQNGGQRRRQVIAATRGRALRRCKSSGRSCEIERRIYRNISQAEKIDAVLDLVGNSVVLDSLAMLCRGGRSCLAGWLGGLDPIPDFNPLLQMPSGVYLTFFGSFVFGTPGFPLSAVPLQQIAQDAAAGRLDVKPVRVFTFENIQEAHRVMEANQASGKMVVVHA